MAIFDQYTTLSLLNESILFNEKDIYYNKDKFDNGEINLCFITGHSGSGKSTMAKDMEKKKEIESYELDDCDLIKDHFSMDNLKEYGDLYYSFFNGPGKKYYVGKEETEKWSNEESEEFWYNLINDVVHYAMQYAKSHSNKKYVINGVQLFQNSFKPEEFKDYAFYIKGTSLIISHIRATKRDAPDDGSKLGKARNFVKNISRIKYWRYCGIAEKAVQKFRKYFQGLIDEQKKSTNEAVIIESIDKSNLSKNFNKKSGKNFKYIRVTKPEDFKYMPGEYAEKDIKFFLNRDDQIIAIDSDSKKFAGMAQVNKKTKEISIFVEKPYRGYGLGDKLLDQSIHKLGGNNLYVFADNKVAIRMYEKVGFKEVRRGKKDGEETVIMKL